MQFLVNVHERRWNSDAVADREAQAMGLARAVVRILPEDHHLRIGIGREVEGREHFVLGRVDLMRAPLGSYEGLQLSPIRLIERAPQVRVPISHGDIRAML